MKNIFLILFLLTFCKANAVDPRTIKIFQPVIPNKIPDLYVPATDEIIAGFLGYRWQTNLDKRLLQIDSAIMLSGFRKRPGEQTWIGEHVGKFLFSASCSYRYSGDDRIKHLMDGMVREYTVCQLPDGYLGTYLPKDYWTDWDVWAHKYAIIGLLSYYSVTGDTNALETARRAADLICRTFGDEKGKRDIIVAGDHVGLAPCSILEPMVDLYRYTGEKRYLDFCEYILRAFEQPNGPKILSTLEKGGSVTQIGDAKAYEMMSCFLGILKYYRLTGQERYLKALQSAWQEIRLHHTYITGSSSQDEIFIDNDHFPGENDDHIGEGCVTVTWIQFNLQLLQITGDPKYSDEIERAVYNHLAAAENPQTGCVSYYTPLQGIRPYKCDQGYSCCLSSVPRGLSLIPDMVWGQINHVFSVLLYEQGEVADSIIANDHSLIALRIKSETNFPLQGRIVYTIIPSANKMFAIQFRVPEWSNQFRATINGKVYEGRKPGFLRIEREWKAGDQLEVRFEMPVKIIPGGISYPGKIAFQRGPQVLAIDSSLNSIPNMKLSSILYEGDQTRLLNANQQLPGNWEWKQAYQAPFRIYGQSRQLLLVPFAEAGQTSSDLIVWIEADKNQHKKNVDGPKR